MKIRSEVELHFPTGSGREGIIECNNVELNEMPEISVHVDTVMVTDGNGWSSENYFRDRQQTIAFFEGMKTLRELLLTAPGIDLRDITIPQIADREE
jgi:hypothetical protein